jgi:hypothetical protein
MGAYAPYRTPIRPHLISPSPNTHATTQVTAADEWGVIAEDTLGLPASLGKALRNTYRSALLPYEQWQRQRRQQQQQQQQQQPPQQQQPAQRSSSPVPSAPCTPSVAKQPPSSQQQQEEEAAAAGADPLDLSPTDIAKTQTRLRTGRLTQSNSAPETAASAAYAKLLEDRRAHVGAKLVVGKKFWRYFPPQDVFMHGTVTAVEKGTRIAVRYDPVVAAEGGKKGKAPAAQVQVRRFFETTGKRDALILLANGESQEGARAIQEGGEYCEGCLRTRVFGAMAECYECGALRHAPCMDPPLKHLPHGDWFCPDCAAAPLNGNGGGKHCAAKGGRMGPAAGAGAAAGGGGMKRKMMAGTGSSKPPGVEELFASFGFEDGDDYTLEGYKAMADAWKAEYFGVDQEVGEEAVEREFWRVVGGGAVKREGEEEGEKEGGPKGNGYRFRAPAELKVEYGSEIDTGVHGSAFPVPAALLKGGNSKAPAPVLSKHPHPPPPPSQQQQGTAGGQGGSKKAERERLKAYERSGWNINNLPVATGSMLHHLDVPVTGGCWVQGVVGEWGRG